MEAHMPSQEMWTLSEDQEAVRMHLPPVQIEGLPKPVIVSLSFTAATSTTFLSGSPCCGRRCSRRRFGISPRGGERYRPGLANDLAAAGWYLAGWTAGKAAMTPRL